MGVIRAETPTRVSQVNQPSRFLSKTSAGTEAWLLTHGHGIYITPSFVSLDVQVPRRLPGLGQRH